MGMTDNQFEKYLSLLTRDLIRIKNKLSEECVSEEIIEDLEELIKNLEQ